MVIQDNVIMKSNITRCLNLLHNVISIRDTFMKYGNVLLMYWSVK